VLDPGVPGRAPRRVRRGEAEIPAFQEQRLPALLYEVHRVLARDGLCWWVTESAHAFRAAHVAGRLGFAIGAPIVWDRGDGPGARLAFVLPLTRGRARSPGAELVQAHRSGDKPHQLPTLLCDALIEAGSEPGDVVVDPFMGGGELGVSALTHARDYLGNDAAPLADLVAARLAKLGGTCSEALMRTREERHAGAAPRSATALADTSTRPGLGIGAAGQLTIFGDGAELR